MPDARQALTRTAGFSLMEVLIALVVLAVGILGVASLQGNSLRSTYGAHLRTQANTLAQDMIERLRANRDYALANGDNYRIAVSDSASGSVKDCSTQTCSAAELAAFDKQQWLTNIETLPKGKARVNIDPANRAATIVVMWDNDRSGATGTDCSGDHQVDLTCMTLRASP